MKTQHSQKHSMENTAVRFKSRNYDPEFKKKVVSFAERRGNQEARRRFGVNESNIRRWRKIQKDLALEKAAGRNATPNKKPRKKRAVARDISNKIDSMPLEQRLKSPSVPSTSDQEQILHSHPLSPTKLKVTRQTKPKELSPKPVTPPPIEEICLKWNSHHGNMQSMFPTLLLKEQYVDATLVAEGQTLKCHRMILSSCSPYFEEVLSNISPYQHPVLFMKDTPFWILKYLCDFMYTGEVLISQDKLNELLSVAESLKIKGLTGKPDVPNEELLKEPLHKHIKEEKRDEFFVEKEPEKKESAREKKRHTYTAATQPPSIPEPIPTKNIKIPKASEPPPAKASKIPKLNTYTESPVVKSSLKLPKANTSHLETVPLKTSTSKVLRSSSTLKKIERADKILIKEAISKGDILDPFDLLEPVYEEVQKELKPPCIPIKAKEAAKSVPIKKGVQKKVKKRKISDDRDESPPPVLSRKGTRSRPNKKIPRFYHSGFDNSAPKIQESPDTTIVREPHTSQAESHSGTADLHSDSTEPLLESQMDQADPLFQLADIKAEPFDVEDSTIEIEDNVVTFSEPDTSMTEEELLEETFESVMNFEDKNVPKDKEESQPFKKIRVTRQVLLDVEKTSMVKIVDVDKIKVSAYPLEEDPLNLPSNLDSSIKIMNVETINENVQSLSKNVSSPSENKETGENSELGFKICNLAGNSEEEKQDENPLGFHITNVVSETEEKGIGQEDNAPTLPVCQITEVFSETETIKKIVADDICEEDAIENINLKNISEIITGKPENTPIQESCITESDITQKNVETPELIEELNFTVPSKKTLNISKAENSAIFTSTSDNSIMKCMDELEDTNDNCSLLKTSINLENIEDTCRETLKDVATDLDYTKREDAISKDPQELHENLNDASAAPTEVPGAHQKLIDNESRTTTEGAEETDTITEDVDSVGKTLYHPNKAVDDLDRVEQYSDRIANVPNRNTDDPARLADNKDLVTDNVDPVVDELGRIADYTKQVVDDVDHTADDPVRIFDDPLRTSDDPVSTIDDPVSTIDDPVRTIDDPVRTIDGPIRTIDDQVRIIDDPVRTIDDPVNDPVCTVDDSNRITDDPIGTIHDPSQIPDYAGQTSSQGSSTGEHPIEVVNNTIQTAGECDKDDEMLRTEDSISNVECLEDIAKERCENSGESEDKCAKGQTHTSDCLHSSTQFHSVTEYIRDINIPDPSANVMSPQVSELLDVREVDQIAAVTERKHDVIESSENLELKPDDCTNSAESNPCLEETFDQAIVTNDLTTSEDIEMSRDESHTKDPVLANAVPYTNEDLPVASAQDDVLPMEVCEEAFSQGAPSFDQTPNSFELADVTQNDASAYSTPGFHIAQVISEQIALNEECRLTNQPMDTSDACFEGSMTTSNELEMIVNDLTKIVGDSQRLDSNMEHEDITESLENLLEK